MLTIVISEYFGIIVIALMTHAMFTISLLEDGDLNKIGFFHNWRAQSLLKQKYIHFSPKFNATAE